MSRLRVILRDAVRTTSTRGEQLLPDQLRNITVKYKIRRDDGPPNEYRRISPRRYRVSRRKQLEPLRGVEKDRNETTDAKRAEPGLFFHIGAMVAAVLKLYFIGTALTVLAVIYGIVDSFGGLMYVQNNQYILELDQQTQRPLTSGSHQRGPSVKTKHIGS